uniref:Ovule protein n=1 Tax=Strongyloides papillosus TaxID=174720 RepID=A0A0N5BP05_STREA
MDSLYTRRATYANVWGVLRGPPCIKKVIYVLLGITFKFMYKRSRKYFTRIMPRDCDIRAWEDSKQRYYCRFKNIRPKTLSKKTTKSGK